MVVNKESNQKDLVDAANKIKLLLTDCDGVLTDTGVYYSAYGEELKRFSIRDGMGVERLRNSDIETGIITGEFSEHVIMRAKKLHITELHLRVKDKRILLEEILERKGLNTEEVAYIGDDTNDIEIMQTVGLSACPADAMNFAKKYADIVLKTKGGQGAFREFAEKILEAKTIYNIKELF